MEKFEFLIKIEHSPPDDFNPGRVGVGAKGRPLAALQDAGRPLLDVGREGGVVHQGGRQAQGHHLRGEIFYCSKKIYI